MCDWILIIDFENKAFCSGVSLDCVYFKDNSLWIGSILLEFTTKQDEPINNYKN